MVGGSLYSEELTEDGLLTGRLLFQDVRKKWPKLPVVILTNNVDPRALDDSDPSQLLCTRQKLGFPPFELVALIDKLCLPPEE